MENIYKGARYIEEGTKEIYQVQALCSQINEAHI